MQGKLRTKLKVIHSIKPKMALIPRRRIKMERDTTPQRWSRRIRSLPPIPINVLSVRRKLKTTNSLPNKEAAKTIEKNYKSSISRIKKEKIYPNISNACGEAGTCEIVRIVPVVVCIKHNKTRFKSLTDDLDIQIKKKNSCKSNSDLKSTLREQLKEECTNLEKKWSRRLKNLPLI